MQNLQQGSKGLAVRDLQRKLNLVMKPTPLLDVDGDFGPLTKSVVKAFQAKYAPPNDGIVGPITRAALEARLPSTPPVNYTVPGIVFVPQDQTMSCWLASAQMLIRWKEKRTNTTDARHPDPSTFASWSQVYRNNNGITNPQIKKFASDIGFKLVPPMTATPNAIEQWLRWYGPLWVNGAQHITVIAGIRGDVSDPEVLVLNPEIPALPFGMWRNLYEFYRVDDYAGPDHSSSTPAVFLRLP